jgi:hypothetical protein
MILFEMVQSRLMRSQSQTCGTPAKLKEDPSANAAHILWLLQKLAICSSNGNCLELENTELSNDETDMKATTLIKIKYL